jgi:hypothetical protein
MERRSCPEPPDLLPVLINILLYTILKVEEHALGTQIFSSCNRLLHSVHHETKLFKQKKYVITS